MDGDDHALSVQYRGKEKFSEWESLSEVLRLRRKAIAPLWRVKGKFSVRRAFHPPLQLFDSGISPPGPPGAGTEANTSGVVLRLGDQRRPRYVIASVI